MTRRLPVLILLGLLVQTSLLLHVSVNGVTPDLMLLLAIAGGMTGGPERGAVVGFASGIGIDLFLQTPVGLSALVFSLVGYAVGMMTESIVRSAWYLPIAIVALASAAGEALFAAAGSVLGRPDLLTPRLGVIAGVVAGANAVLAPPALWVMRRVQSGTRRRRPAVA